MRRRPTPKLPDGSPLPIVWTERALSDLEAIGDYIAADNPQAAEHWIDELLAAVARASHLPLAGRTVPEIGRPDVREILRRTYRIVYRVHADRLEVLTVFEGHRQFPDSP